MTDSSTTDDEIIASFAAGTLGAAGFHHRDHVRLAWLHLRRHPAPVALDRFTSGLRRLAAAAGQPDRYHETVTWVNRAPLAAVASAPAMRRWTCSRGIPCWFSTC